jgi:hypothetical protein
MREGVETERERERENKSDGKARWQRGKVRKQ